MKVRRTRKWLLLTALFALIFPLFLLPGYAGAQQIYHGDGATNNGSGGWTIGAPPSNLCLLCHSMHGVVASKPCLLCHRTGGVASHIGVASDMTSYLMTGHKNMVRKVAPGAPWKGADGTPYGTTNDLYGSGSTYDWTAGTVNVAGTGTIKPIFYILGGWTDRGQLNTVFDGGFTGELYPNGNYDCGRCHVTGYRFDASGPEPTTYNGILINDTQFSRFPTDFTAGTSSWSLTGIQCERCHSADNGTNNHTASGAIAGGIPTKPTTESATALCIECHRQESADTTVNTITLSTVLAVSDEGSCSDSVSPDYATCLSFPGNTWNYVPFFDADKGQSFLSSPHARFAGSLTQTVQNSSDLSVTMTGAYNSAFTDTATGKNKGCTGCHDPHQSTVEVVGAPTPFVKNCDDCHALALNILTTINHRTGPGTPFPTGTSADIPKSCAVCHMSSGYHFFRISVDPGYRTFPTAAQLYVGGQSIANTASDSKGFNAVWADVDLACGQCHVGSGTIGVTTPSLGAPVLDKARLASNAVNIHGPDIATITASASGNGTITPSGAIPVTPGQSQTFNIAATTPGNKIAYVAVDGVAVTPVPSTYTFSNVLVNHTITVSFVPVIYTITVNQPQNGSITPYTSSNIPYGANVTYNITANPGYHVTDVQVDGVSQGALPSYTFSTITADHSISATIDVNPSYQITASAGPGGTISPSGTTSVIGGLSQIYTITPNPGYVVSSLIVDGGNVNPVTSYGFYDVNASHTITANFVNMYTITASVTSSNGSISPSGSVGVAAGTSQTFAIAANPGYKINYVAVNGASVGAVSSYTFNNVRANFTIKADFVPITYKITVTQTPNGYITPDTYSGFRAGANQTYNIRPNAGYHIVDVQVDGSPVGAVTSYPFTNIQANHTITATFAINPSYNITASAVGDGTITPNGITAVVGGLNQKYTITPGSGSKILSVVVDGVNVGPVTSYTFYTVNAAHTIVANFQ